MLAVDTNVWIAYFNQEQAADISALERQAVTMPIALPPVVLSELLSDPEFPPSYKPLLKKFFLLDITPGYWERAGETRAQLIAKKLRPKLPDTLIAQSCVDHDVPLLTRDTGFRMFAKHAGLKLYKAG